MKEQTTTIDFGKRLARLRKARGFTQYELGELVNVTRRVIAYYECETKYPPAHLVIPLAKALGVTTDELLGVQKMTADNFDEDLAKLWRKLKVIGTFAEKDKKAVLHFVNTIVQKDKVQHPH
jgi:transcriptional regulator with XRE-family HTH domain